MSHILNLFDITGVFLKLFLFVLFEEEEVLIISVFTINFPVVVPQL